MFETVRLRTAVAPILQQMGHGESATSKVASNRQAENLVLTIFWLLFLEGALRKWVAPEYSRILFFVRDPFVLLLYWRALRSDAFRNPSPFLQIGLMFAGVALLLSFVQSITFGDSRILAVVVYGWRQYFLYLPLPFAMASMVSRDFLPRFARHTFIAMVIMAPIVFLQFHSPPSAVINRGIADDEALQFQSFSFTGGGVRPSGPFTSTVGVVHIIPSTFALLLGLWLTAPRLRKISMPMLVVSGAATATCLAVSGSRAAFMHLGIVVLSSLVLGLVTRQSSVRTKALVLPLALVGLGAVLYPIVFPDAFAAMLGRVVEANSVEMQGSPLGIFGRALYDAVDFVRFMQHSPLLGYGFGLGGNGRTYLGGASAVLADVPYAESDWSRNIVDFGPIFGVLFILYRIIFTVTLGIQAIRATNSVPSPLPLLLFGYVGIGLFYGQLTGHGTVGGFIWIYLGLLLISLKRQP